MKRFTKMLALGMTLAMVFGMSVNASSDKNPSPKPWQVPGTVTAVEEMPGGWTQGTITEEAYNNAKSAAESSSAKAQIEQAHPGWTFDAVMDVWNFGWYEREEDGKKLAPEDGIVKVKMPALPDKDNYTYAILHYNTADLPAPDQLNHSGKFRAVKAGACISVVTKLQAREPTQHWV